MKKKAYIAIAMCAAISCTVALADWPDGPNGGGHVMTAVQLPDITDGTNVMVDALDKAPRLADDWQASRDAQVRDLHIWYSWNTTDSVTYAQNAAWFTGIAVRFHEDATDTSGNRLGQPGAELWSSWFDLSNFDLGDGISSNDPLDEVETREQYPNAQGGWWDNFNRSIGTAPAGVTHTGIWQLNLYDLAAGTPGVSSPQESTYLEQVEGEYYWVSLAVEVSPDAPALGWHTSTDGSADAYAVYNTNAFTGSQVNWMTLPLETNLAFVVTPEPSAFALLTLCGISLCARRRAKRRTDV